MGFVVMLALAGDEVDRGIEIYGTEGLCPVAELPRKVLSEERRMVQLVRRRTLHAAQDLAERQARGETRDDVHMIRWAARSNQLAPDLLGMPAQHGLEASACADSCGYSRCAEQILVEHALLSAT